MTPTDRDLRDPAALRAAVKAARGKAELEAAIAAALAQERAAIDARQETLCTQFAEQSGAGNGCPHSPDAPCGPCNQALYAWLDSLQNEPCDLDYPDYRAWAAERDHWLARMDRMDASKFSVLREIPICRRIS